MVESNSQAFEAVKEYFSAPDYEASQVGDKPILDLKFEGSFGDRDEEWKAQIIVSDNISFKKVVLFSFIPFKITRGKQEEVVELLNRINCVEDIGNFELNYNTGQVRCKTSFEVMSENITSNLLYSIETKNTDLMGKYIPMIDRVSKGELLPMDAIDDDDYDNYD